MNIIISFILDFLQVSRPGWWLVSLWLYIAPCGSKQDISLSGLALVVFPLNVIVYGINDMADLNNDLENDRKGNFVFGPKGWSKARLMRVLMPSIVMTGVVLSYWGYGSMQLEYYILWFLHTLVVNYSYNFHSFIWKILLVAVGYGSVTLLSFWQHGGVGFGFELHSNGRWYLAGCNQEYWIHLVFLLLRSQLWTELLDYDYDRKKRKWTTLSRLSSKVLAQSVVLSVLLLEAFWCWLQCYFYHGSEWFTLLCFSCMGCFLFVSLEYTLPSKHAPDLTWLALAQNAGGVYLLYDCWQRGIFVQ
mmetsp:Transcript_2101/g.3215  ORF Transcript_2101/g.3215 Transcript_2101/m.3215 type:complete len:303 (+) Transcript_2101:25-933(+)